MIPAPGATRVWILTETFHPVTGGGETQARALAVGLQELGMPVRLVTRRTDSALATTDTVDGVPVQRIGPAGRGHLKRWAMLPGVFRLLARCRHEYDVLLVCGFRALGIPAALAGRLWRKPCILKADSRGEWSGAFFDAGLARFGLRHDHLPVKLLLRLRNGLLRRAGGFVAVSEVIEQEYRDGGVPAQRIVRIPNSVDPERFRPATESEKAATRARLGIPPAARVAVFTGRLTRTKGLPGLLRAWREVVPKDPDALLLLVGGGGLALQNCEAELRDFVAEHQLQHSVRFTGPVEDVEHYLRAADLFVFPSEQEAFGISVIEAMACGLPTVTTGIDGIRDIVRPGTDGWLVAPGDEAGLAAAILRGLSSDPEIERMGDAARKHACTTFSTDSVIERYRATIERILQPCADRMTS